MEKLFTRMGMPGVIGNTHFLGSSLKNEMEFESKLPVTVAIPVKDEAENIARCLDRLKRFQEVVVIDSGSRDGTLEIAERFGARIVQFDWNGQYPKKRNWFLINEAIVTPWILFLDADEYVDDRFCDAIEIAAKRDHVDGYWLKYNNYFLGKPIRRGLVQRKLALFRVGKALYEKVDEKNWSALDMEIHEHPIVFGNVGEIDSRLDHNDYKGIAHFIAKHREYALWEAKRYATLRNNLNNWSHLTKRQRFKYSHIYKWWYPLFYFLFAYILKRGFLDGSAGFYYAFYKAWYFQTIRLLIQENVASSLQL